MQKIARPSVFSKTSEASYKTSDNSLEAQTAACVSELMNATTSFHKLHLKVTGEGSYAAHKALNELYDALPDLADNIAEGFQGATEKLLDCKESSPKILNSVEESLSYIREMSEMINGLQKIMPYTEIVNDLDNIKSALNSAKYKLKFLK
jgi:DNA-binding ferritin-like protein